MINPLILIKKIFISDSFASLSSMSLSNNYSINSNFTFKNARNFAIVNSSYYYVVEAFLNGIMIFNDQWEFQYVKNYTNPLPYFLIAIDQYAYISSNTKFCKTDLNLNVQKCYSGFSYRSIYYNKIDQMLYVVNYQKQRIDKFDKNLNLLKSITIAPKFIHGVSGYDNNLVISNDAGKIYVYWNFVNVTSFQTFCSGFIPQIHVDAYGFITVCCYYGNALYFYHANGTYLGKSINNVAMPMHADYDLNGKFVIISSNQIYTI